MLKVKSLKKFFTNSVVNVTCHEDKVRKTRSLLLKKVTINFKITLEEACYLYFPNLRACQSSYRVKGHSVIFEEGTCVQTQITLFGVSSKTTTKKIINKVIKYRLSYFPIIFTCCEEINHFGAGDELADLKSFYNSMNL